MKKLLIASAFSLVAATPALANSEPQKIQFMNDAQMAQESGAAILKKTVTSLSRTTRWGKTYSVRYSRLAYVSSLGAYLQLQNQGDSKFTVSDSNQVYDISNYTGRAKLREMAGSPFDYVFAFSGKRGYFTRRGR